MDIVGVFIMFLAISFLSSIGCRNSVIKIIEEVGVFPLRHPKRYIVTPKWVRKVFKIKHRFIPRYFYFELILSLFYAALGPINIIIYTIFSGYSANIGGILVMFHACLIIVDTIFLAIISFIMKKT